MKKKILQIIASKKEDTSTFSATMRELNKNSPEKVKDFMKAFKEAFDEAMDQSLEDHQNVALLQAKQKINAS
jgi:hypothetical protein